MKGFISAAFILVAIAAGVWFVLSLSARVKYDHTRADLAGLDYAVVAFDQRTRALEQQVEATWTRGADDTNGPNSAVVRLAGLPPCVTNLVYVFNYRMPEYRWLHPAQNRKAAVFGLLKAKFFPVSVDRLWHISDDGHLALLWCRTNMVYVFRDEGAGMRETLFYKKKQIVEQDGAPNRSQPVVTGQ